MASLRDKIAQGRFISMLLLIGSKMAKKSSYLLQNLYTTTNAKNANINYTSFELYCDYHSCVFFMMKLTFAQNLAQQTNWPKSRRN